MALIKGNKSVKTTKKIKPSLDFRAILPYLKKTKLGLFNQCSSFFHFLFKFIFHSLVAIGPLFIVGLIYGYETDYVPLFSIFLIPLICIISYIAYQKIFPSEGWIRYGLTDGFSWWKTASLLSPLNPSPGLKVVGTQVVTSRFLVVPGPESTYTGLTKKIIPAHLMFGVSGALFFSLQLGQDVSYLHIVDFNFHLAFMLIWVITAWIYGFKVMDKPLGQARRFFIFDRKKQTLSYHPSFFSRKMLTYPWVEFEARAVWEHRSGYSCKLIHAPTGNMLELQGPDLHWNNAGAVEAYSYVARFMDLSQPLPDEIEFERYLPEKENLDHLSNNEYFAHMSKIDKERKLKREKYHNPNADTVFSKMASFEQAIKEHPWLSAKNVWAAAHKYGKQPNWDKWVRDKWGIAANEDYQVAKSDREGEPEWFPQFFEYLKTNKNKLKYMDDDTRIMFFQDWFEETFPELHWVDPVTADCYEQEEVFL